jgi:phospholipid/cholesterol/gamma-HCH transport system ATP-binding protein
VPPRPAADAPPDRRAAAPSGSPATIRLVDVHLAFGKKQVLRGMNLTIARGTTHVVLGPSGTGKSVTLKLIVGLLKPDRGEVWVDDVRVDQAKGDALYEVRNRIGFLFQSSALINWLSVADNVALPMTEHRELGKDDVARRVDDYLQKVHMQPSKEQMPAELSGGQKRRVALARVLAGEPQVILYDEPTAGLDPVMTNNISDLIRRVQQEFHVTSILVTHDLAAAFETGDRISMIDQGQVVFEADTEEFKRADHPVVRNFLNGGRSARGEPKS